MEISTNYAKSIIFLIVIFLLGINLSAQYSLRDVYGHLLPTPSWPPPDSVYDSHTLTIWFNRDAINQDFLCNYWYYFYHPVFPMVEGNKDNENDLLSTHYEYPIGCFPLTPALFTNETLFNDLDSLGVVELCQYSRLSPCEDTTVLTHYGTTIPAPEFWNSFYVVLDTTNALSALQYLILKYGGKLIDFAELNTYMHPDGNLPNNPNDSAWVGGYQTAFLDTIFGENIHEAWKYEHGKRDIKVAVIDNGIQYTHPDFGGALGCDSCRVINGREWDFHSNYKNGFKVNWDLKEPYLTHFHGTSCAALIGARVNNEIGISGIAGGWSKEDGVSLFSIKMNLKLEADTNFSKPGWADAFVFSSVIDTNYYTRESNTFESYHESKRKGFGVHIISNSNSDYLYSELLRRAIDFAYKTGVVIFSSKGNKNSDTVNFPVDLEYNKIIAIGAYSVRPESGLKQNYIPTRWHYGDINKRYTINGNSGSNYGYGLDILGHTNNLVPVDENIVRNYSLYNDSNYVKLYQFTKTSAATAQVAGVGGLILSKFLSPELRRNFRNYEVNPDTAITWLAPEDVQGLLCISADDLRYFWDTDKRDTIGYDSETGYGMMKADKALKYMLPPYELRHYKIDAPFTTNLLDSIIDPFFILAPWYYNEQPLLAPTSDTSFYWARRYRVRQKVTFEQLGIDNWIIARSWGRGGRGTIGWSGVQPIDGECNVVNNPSGWCRVVGDCMPGDTNFNYNNIRDISYRNDTLTLETFCYLVFDKATNDTLGWYPVPPDSVVYRITVWGASDTTLGIQNFDYYNYKNTIECYAITNNISQLVKINFKSERPNKITYYVYNSLGNLVCTDELKSLTNEGYFFINFSKYSSGAYYVVLRSDKEFGFCNFVFER